MQYELRVNGETHSVEAEPDTPLLWVLREELGLSGTKFGCGIAQCGACTVHLADRPVRSCVLPVEYVGEKEIRTIEGLEGPVADAVRDAWVETQVAQCGYCQSGQVMSAIALLEQIPTPSDDDIDRAMNGNICRCATYPRIRRAIHAAAEGVKS
ncbi:MAG: (2Fe-2S)-binding protein [Acidobacteriota bacterium]